MLKKLVSKVFYPCFDTFFIVLQHTVIRFAVQQFIEYLENGNRKHMITDKLFISKTSCILPVCAATLCAARQWLVLGKHVDSPVRFEYLS